MRTFKSGAFQTGSLAREEIADGKTVKEIEYMFYARLEDISALLAASEMMIQTQWGLWYEKGDASAASGSVRQRRNSFHMLQRDGTLMNVRRMMEYIITTKVKTKDGHAQETSIRSSVDMFESFQYLADSGMLKHRYVIPIEGTELKWEVDMFVQPGEHYTTPKYLPWCKIDLEVPSLDTPIPEYPKGFLDMFNTKGDGLSEDQQKVVADMKQYLSLPNPHVKQVYQGLV